MEVVVNVKIMVEGEAAVVTTLCNSSSPDSNLFVAKMSNSCIALCL